MSEPPINQRIYFGKNWIVQLGSWMIRELVSYLDLDDFLSFLGTCEHLSKYTFDPYITHSSALKQCCLDVPTSDILKQVGFLHKLRQGDREPVTEVVEDGMLQTVFYYNTKRRLLYSYYHDLLKVFKLEGLAMTPVYEKSVPAIPNVLAASGFGKQFYLANSSTLISLHEGEVEGLSYNAELGWGTAQTEVECEEGVKLEVLEGGRTVILALKMTVHLFNYSLTPLQTLPTSPSSLLYVPSALAHSYIMTDNSSLKVHHTNSTEPFTIPKPNIIIITKIKACRSGGKEFLIYLQGSELMKNKTSLGQAVDFTIYKHHLFTCNDNSVYYSDLSHKSIVFKALPINISHHHLWMNADNHKLVFVYREREVFYLHIYDFKSKNSSRFSIPINGYKQIYQREGCILVVKGYVWGQDSELTEPRTLFYSLESSRPMTPYSRDISVSPESAHFNTSFNFLSESRWKHTKVRPLKVRILREGHQTHLVCGHTWSELAHKVLLRSSARCSAKVKVDISNEVSAFAQIRVLVWRDRQVIDSHETPQMLFVKQICYRYPLMLTFELAEGGCYLEVIIGGRAENPSTKSYLKNPRLRIRYA